MASIDVNDAFDASFISEFYYSKPKIILNEEGIYVTKLSKYKVQLGVVLPNETEHTTLDPANEYIVKSIRVYIPAYLLNHQTYIQPADIIYWNNQHYKAEEVRNYMQYGKGYTIIIAALMDASDQPEVQPIKDDEE